MTPATSDPCVRPVDARPEAPAPLVTGTHVVHVEHEGIGYIENTEPGGRVRVLCNDPGGKILELQPATV